LGEGLCLPVEGDPCGRSVEQHELWDDVAALTKKKLRRLEITAGAPKRTPGARGVWSANNAVRDAERALAEQAEASYKRMVQDQLAGGPARKVGASATPEHA
jgi:hypothetical protein